jgi:uncharacterized protein (TIGR02996 family)
MTKEAPFMPAIPREGEIPFLRDILNSPSDLSLRLVYADWLEECGDATRAEWLRMWVVLNDPGNPENQTGAFRTRFQELGATLNRQWVGFVSGWRTLRPDEPELHSTGWGSQKTDAHLGYGPCVVCGRMKPQSGCVSRMPCESCGRVFCWQCADTGVYGSLADFRHFVTGSFRRAGYRLGRDSCLFCQDMCWMQAHGG